jgi:hypothetical protein
VAIDNGYPETSYNDPEANERQQNGHRT